MRNAAGSLWTRAARLRYDEIFFIIIALVLAVSLRWSLLEFKSVDYLDYTRIWYNTIKAQGFSAFGQNFFNYNPPYLYALYLVIRFNPDLPGVIATKIPSLIGDFICAWFVYKTVQLRHPDPPFPFFAASAIFFGPTIVLNSAFWGQADSLYTTALIACLYFLLTKKNSWALLAYGTAIAFKFQATFLFPLLLILLLKKGIPLKHFFLVPAVYGLSLLPCWLAGRPLADLVGIYYSQANQYQQLTMTAPTLYAWLPDSGKYFPFLYLAGLILALSLGLIFIALAAKSQAELTPPLIIELALISVIMMPFFLPKMHDRYFYPADVVSVIFAFYFPKYYYIPIAITSVSFLAYQPTLFGVNSDLLPFLALIMFAVFVLLVRDLVGRLYPKAGAL